MTPPSRRTAGGSVYLDLRAKARREGRPTDELFILYILERFLYRVSISPYRHRLVLKGGMLLAAFDERRPTADVDLLAEAIDNEVGAISAVVREVLTIEVDDGVTFDQAELRAQVIRDADPYTGVRITVPARIDRARRPLRVDINVGDPVTPAPVEVNYPALLGEPFALVGYPLETVLAEKIVTMIDRGDATTRDRDFVDVFLLSGRHAVDGEQFGAALRATGAHRGSDLRPVVAVLVDLASARQADWTRYLARNGLEDAAPASLSDAIRAIADFADPVLAGEVTAGAWDPATRRWRPV